MAQSDDSLIPEAPSLADWLPRLVGDLAGWITGSAAVATVIVLIVGTILALKSWLDAAKTARDGAIKAAEITRGVIKRLGQMPIVGVVFAAALTVAVLVGQAYSLAGAWWTGLAGSDLWNLVTWGSWESSDTSSWSSFTGIYTAATAVVLLLAWVAALKLGDWADAFGGLLLIGYAVLVLPALIAVALVILLVILVAFLAFLVVVSIFDGVNWPWQAFANVAEVALLLALCTAGNWLAVVAPGAVMWAWQRDPQRTSESPQEPAHGHGA